MAQRYKHLNLRDRYKLYRRLSAGIGISKIAEELGVHRSTVYREVKRNKCAEDPYFPDRAQQYSQNRAPRKGYSKIESSNWLRKIICDHIVAMAWSPDSIAGRLELEYGKQIISRESIYKWIYGRGKSYKLYEYLHQRKRKRGRRPCLKAQKSKIPNRVSIHQRPEAAKSDFGHWESDTVLFSGHKGAIVTLYEKKTKLFLGAKMPNRHSDLTFLNLEQLLKPFPSQARQTITFDNGSEFAQHQRLRYSLNLDTFFCDSYASWQKGGVEHANGMLRKYIPKGSKALEYSDQDVSLCFKRINSMPRKSLGYKNAYESFLHEINPNSNMMNLFNQSVALHS